jgi:hypothetical protein
LVSAVTSQQAREQEIRSIAAEMVGSLRIVSEGINPLTKAGMRALCVGRELGPRLLDNPRRFSATNQMLDVGGARDNPPRIRLRQFIWSPLRGGLEKS